MESAFRTILSAAGVMATCYVLAAATWIQVLLLFLAASLGWCVYSCRSKKQQGATPAQRLDSRGFVEEMETITPRAQHPAEPVQASIPKAHVKPAYRFPIHKLAGPSTLLI